MRYTLPANLAVKRIWLEIGLISFLVCMAHATARADQGSLHVMRVDDLRLNFHSMAGADLERYRLLDANGERQSSRSYKLLLGQRLGLRAEGSFVHPLFWSWQATGSGFLIADFLEGNVLSLDPDLAPRGDMQARRLVLEPGFDVRFDFLREHPYPVSVFARRDTHIVRPDFQKNYWLSTLSAGGSAAWRNSAFPLSANYNYYRHEGEKGETPIRQTGSEMHQVSVSGQDLNRPSLISTDYRMSSYENHYYPETDYLFHTGDARSTVYLDNARDYRLDSRLRALHRDYWDAEQAEVRLTEQMIGRLIPSLRLKTQYDLAWLQWSDADTIQNAGLLELRHQLFKSLTTVAFGRIVYDHGEDTRRLQEVLSAGTTYRKDLGPLVMTHGYQAMATWSSFASDEVFVTVVDEPIAFPETGGIPVRLASPNVNVDSIRVVDSTGTIQYLRGEDYEVEQTEGVTYIRRLLSGNIPEDTTVLVSYEYRAAADEKTFELYQRYFSRLETDIWDSLRFFAEYALRDIDVTSSVVPDDDQGDVTYQDVTAGVNAAGQGASAEAHFRYTTSEHYDAYEFTAGASYALPLGASFRPVVGAREIYLIVELESWREKKNLFELYSQANYPLFGPVVGRWNLSYRWESGGYNDGHHVWGMTAAEWRLREVLFSIEYALGIQLKEYQEYDRHNISLNIRRGF